MAKAKLDNKMIGMVLMVVGIGLAFWGYQMSGSIGSQLNQAFSGSASDGVLIRYIAGGISFAIGAYFFRK